MVEQWKCAYRAPFGVERLIYVPSRSELAYQRLDHACIKSSNCALSLLSLRILLDSSATHLICNFTFCIGASRLSIGTLRFSDAETNSELH